MEHLNWYVCAKNRKLQITVSWLLCNSMFFFEFYCCEFLLLLLFELKIQKIMKSTENNRNKWTVLFSLLIVLCNCRLFSASTAHTHTHSIAHNDVYVCVCVLFSNAIRSLGMQFENQSGSNEVANGERGEGEQQIIIRDADWCFWPHNWWISASLSLSRDQENRIEWTYTVENLYRTRSLTWIINIIIFITEGKVSISWIYYRSIN